MPYRASFCDPFQKEIINLGTLSNDAIIAHFESIDWRMHLSLMAKAREEAIYFSPSLGVETSDGKQGLSISAVGEPTNYEFYVFYKRPKTIRIASGETVVVSPEHLSDITGQTRQHAMDCLQAFLRNDTAYLETKMGGVNLSADR